VLILHFEASPELVLYDEKNVGANRKHVYAERAALTVLTESCHRTDNHKISLRLMLL